MLGGLLVAVDSSGGVTLSRTCSSFLAGGSSLILALLLRVRSTSGLPDLALLLGSLVLPGGGEEVKFPSNAESCRGGREERGT